MSHEVHRVITLKWGGQYEAWLRVYSNGQLELHTENDGYAALRHGLQPRDEWVSLKYIKSRWPQFVDQVEAALVELRPEEG